MVIQPDEFTDVTYAVEEDAFAVRTPGGPVLAGNPERPEQVEPKPTLGAH